MADTAILYTKTDELAKEATSAFEAFQNNGDLVELNNSLANLRDNAEQLRDVADRIDDILGEL